MSGLALTVPKLIGLNRVYWCMKCDTLAILWAYGLVVNSAYTACVSPNVFTQKTVRTHRDAKHSLDLERPSAASNFPKTSLMLPSFKSFTPRSSPAIEKLA